MNIIFHGVTVTSVYGTDWDIKGSLCAILWSTMPRIAMGFILQLLVSSSFFLFKRIDLKFIVAMFY